MEGLESGGIGRRIRRAKGSLAAREKRFRDLKAVAPESSPKGSLAQAHARVESLFVNMLSVLKPLQSLPMYETILFSNAEQLCAFSTGIGNSAEPRDSFLSAMRRFRDELGDMPAEQVPSIAQAYEILAEGGRMINLSEWYHAFDSVRHCAHARNYSGLADQTEDEIGANPEASNGEMLSSELTTQAQFARAVAELEFLGILKHTNRKTDHVIRLLYE
jgi:Origin recognition complex winged helix C-terminal